MRSIFPRWSAMAAAVLLGAGSAPVMAPEPALTSPVMRQVQMVKRIRHGAAYSAGAYGRKGAGVSMAAQQRASRKARNVARNRRSHR